MFFQKILLNLCWDWYEWVRYFEDEELSYSADDNIGISKDNSHGASNATSRMVNDL